MLLHATILLVFLLCLQSCDCKIYIRIVTKCNYNLYKHQNIGYNKQDINMFTYLVTNELVSTKNFNNI